MPWRRSDQVAQPSLGLFQFVPPPIQHGREVARLIVVRINCQAFLDWRTRLREQVVLFGKQSHADPRIYGARVGGCGLSKARASSICIAKTLELMANLGEQSGISRSQLHGFVPSAVG